MFALTDHAKARSRPVEDRDLAKAQRKVGELSMDNDISWRIEVSSGA